MSEEQESLERNQKQPLDILKKDSKMDDNPVTVRVWSHQIYRWRNIEEKAIALLQDLETSMEPNSPVRLLNPRFEDLGKAIGITIEELRGEQ